MRLWKAFPADVRSLAFSSDGMALACASPVAGVKLFDVPTGRELWHFNESSFAPHVRFTSDDKHVISLVSQRIAVLGAADGAERARHSRRIASFAASQEPGTLFVFTAGMDVAELRHLNLSDGAVLWKKALKYHGGVMGMELSPDGRTIGTTGDLEALVLDVETKKLRSAEKMRADPNRPPALAFDPDGTVFVFAEKAQLNVLRVASAERLESVASDGPPFRGLAFKKDGRALFAVRGTSRVEEWNVQSRELRNAYDWKAGKLTCVAVSPDGALAAAGGATGNVVVWDVDL